ncbi:hypothetical protein HYC85_011926 [Camellia sinensis]|uniref:Protein kinase domain-containing protein n=1 Tax=Camellia sinensis TaxID=4442 RepID=A0A7J7HAH1_CAMSI|nr:hypothetical protein HYC85_011926 [Camellia sinensis]
MERDLTMTPTTQCCCATEPLVDPNSVMASKTKIYIVLEYVGGGKLFDKIAKLGRLKEDEARRYFQQLINAVDYCHSRGVYHRDLKPENLLLDSFGVLKVSDFGLSAFSQQVWEDGLLHTACGTPNYVAPEVFTDKGYDGTAADICSCGVVLFVLMAGYLPFDEPNHMALYRRVDPQGRFFLSIVVFIGGEKLIMRILDPNPLTRITIPQILENGWCKKSYKPPQFEQGENVNLDDIDAIFNDTEVFVFAFFATSQKVFATPTFATLICCRMGRRKKSFATELDTIFGFVEWTFTELNVGVLEIGCPTLKFEESNMLIENSPSNPQFSRTRVVKEVKLANVSGSSEDMLMPLRRSTSRLVKF